ncbi:MAG: BatA domain-containing protein [Elusimicrobia bacterium]|nr:BatA domain-containing protein [Elusimicrobiota bacterium]
MNFHFLNPSFLWLLPIVALPILLHLFLKRPPKSLLFSDLQFLKKTYIRTRPRRNRIQILILACRVLTLLFLILFFSRPVTHLGAGSGRGDSVALVILLDRSYSMRAIVSGISSFERAKTLAKKTLESLKELDRSALIVFSETTDYFSGYFTHQPQDHQKQLDSTNPGYRVTQIVPALQKAYQILAAHNASNKAVLLITDRTRQGWTEIPGSWENRIENFDPNVKILVP